MLTNIYTRFWNLIKLVHGTPWLVLNKLKINVYKKVPKEVTEKYDGAEDNKQHDWWDLISRKVVFWAGNLFSCWLFTVYVSLLAF